MSDEPIVIKARLETKMVATNSKLSYEREWEQPDGLTEEQEAGLRYLGEQAQDMYEWGRLTFYRDDGTWFHAQEWPVVL